MAGEETNGYGNWTTDTAGAAARSMYHHHQQMTGHAMALAGFLEEFQRRIATWGVRDEQLIRLQAQAGDMANRYQALEAQVEQLANAVQQLGTGEYL